MSDKDESVAAILRAGRMAVDNAITEAQYHKRARTDAESRAEELRRWLDERDAALALMRREIARADAERDQAIIDLVQAKNKACEACIKEEQDYRKALREEEKQVTTAKKNLINVIAAALQKKPS